MRFASRNRRRRSNVQVRGCGCCLPFALGMLSVPVLGFHLLVTAVR